MPPVTAPTHHHSSNVSNSVVVTVPALLNMGRITAEPTEHNAPRQRRGLAQEFHVRIDPTSYVVPTASLRRSEEPLYIRLDRL